MRFSRRLVVVSVIAVAALSLVTLPTLASAASGSGKSAAAAGEKPSNPPDVDPGLTPDEWQRQIDQQPLFDLRARVAEISSLAAGSPAAGTVFDVPNQTLVVYWRGDVPTALVELGGAAEADGYRLDIKPAVHSAAELSVAAMELAELAGSPSGLSVEMSYDGSGLVVRYPGLDGAVDFPATADVRSAIDEIASRGVNVRVEPSGDEVPTFASRDDDNSPYWGGALTNDGSALCTNAFGMQAGATYQYMLTAAHCGSFLDGKSIYNGQGTYMGYTDYLHELFDLSGYDLGLIRLKPGAASTSRFYATPPAPAPGFASRLVVGYDAGGILTGVNANYCTSGAALGVHCNVYAQNQQVVCVAGVRCIYAVIVNSNSTSVPVICRGDSGGPIYFHQSGMGSNNVTAAGVVSGAYLASGANCGWQGWISVVATAIGTIPGLQIRAG